MPPTESRRRALTPLSLCLLALLGACGHLPRGSREHECMTRVMYFESNRSSADGMLAVGTVVMNRVESGKYPKTVCGVVGQKNQFAKGVLSKPMKEGKSKALAEKVASDVLRGKRHRGVGDAMFFHTAGYSFPYKNMHYKVVAGGNAFYEKRNPTFGRPNRTQSEVLMAARERPPSRYDPKVEIASRPVEAPPVEAASGAAPALAAAAVEIARRPAEAPMMAASAMPPAALAVAPVILAPTSIEDLIAMNGG
jgi:hypothetical protein